MSERYTGRTILSRAKLAAPLLAATTLLGACAGGQEVASKVTGTVPPASCEGARERYIKIDGLPTDKVRPDQVAAVEKRLRVGFCLDAAWAAGRAVENYKGNNPQIKGKHEKVNDTDYEIEYDSFGSHIDVKFGLTPQGGPDFNNIHWVYKGQPTIHGQDEKPGYESGYIAQMSGGNWVMNYNKTADDHRVVDSTELIFTIPNANTMTVQDLRDYQDKAEKASTSIGLVI